jgi:hypothetical protein
MAAPEDIVTEVTVRIVALATLIDPFSRFHPVRLAKLTRAKPIRSHEPAQNGYPYTWSTCPLTGSGSACRIHSMKGVPAT